jgi:putative membrane-bound dehydrogenase-like protein
MIRLRAAWLFAVVAASAAFSFDVPPASAVDLAKPAAGDDIASQHLSPAEALKAFTLRPGLEIELVAAEPLVVDPVAFAWGADGRLWVVEMRDYPLGLDGKGKSGGVVKILDDDDGDGRYDRATVFLDGLAYPTSVLPYRNGAFICSVPEILFASDTDGDSRADNRSTVVSRLTVGNPQHLANGLRLGLDGWIHCANGGTNTVAIAKRWNDKEVQIGTRDFRFHPETGEVEPLAGRSQCLRETDDFGNWFGSNNSNPMFHFVLEEQYLKRNPFATYPNPQRDVSVTPGASEVFPTSKTVIRFNQPQSANRFTSACSATFYRDDFLGEEFCGNSFVCEPVHNLVHREIVEPKGQSFTSRRAADEQKSEFLSSTDNWFRPSMVRTGPDGALWVADMYRLVIEHPEWISKEWQAKLDLRAGSDKGRIYRIFPKGLKPWPIPKLARLTELELVAKLESPNGIVRDMAQQLLVERFGSRHGRNWGGDKSRSFEKGHAVEALIKLVNDAGRPTARLHAISTLALFGDELDTIVLRKALADEHPGVRRMAIRLADNEQVLLDPELFPAMAKAAVGSEPLEMQLALALGDVDPTDARAVLLAKMLCDDGLLGAAAKSSLNKVNLGDVARGLSTLQVPDPKVPVSHMIDIAAAMEDNVVLKHLFQLVENGPPAKRREATIAILEGLSRQGMTLAKLRHLLSLRKTVDDFRDYVATLRALVVDEKASLADRTAAFGILGHDSEFRTAEIELIRRLLTPQTPDELQAAAIAACRHYPDATATELMLAAWPGFSPTRRAQTLDVCLSRVAAAELIVDAIAAKMIAPAEIDIVRTQALLYHKYAPVREKARKVLAANIDANRSRVVDEFQSALTLAGDAARGKQVFATSCANCHKLGDVGHSIGPDLLALTDKRPETTLISLFDPNRAVESKYTAYTAETILGLTYTGVLVGESSHEITLALADGKRQTIARRDLESFRTGAKSFMPEGMEKDLTPQKVADLLAFLKQAK